MKKNQSNPLASIVGWAIGFIVVRFIGWQLFVPFGILIGALAVQYGVIKDEARRKLIPYTSIVLMHGLGAIFLILLPVLGGYATWTMEFTLNSLEFLFVFLLAGALMWKPRFWLGIVVLLINGFLFMGVLDVVMAQPTLLTAEGVGFLFNVLARVAALIALVYATHYFYVVRNASEPGEETEAVPAEQSARHGVMEGGPEAASSMLTGNSEEEPAGPDTGTGGNASRSFGPSPRAPRAVESDLPLDSRNGEGPNPQPEGH